MPAPYSAPPGQRRLPLPIDAAPRSSLGRRAAYIAGIATISVVAAAGAFFAFQLSGNPADGAPELVIAEPAAEPIAADVAAPQPAEPAAPEPQPVIVNVERIDPRVAADPDEPGPADPGAAPVEGAADPAAPEPVRLVDPVAEPVPAPAPAAEAAPQVAATPEPIVTTEPVSDFGVTTAWVNLRTGPSNTNAAISVVAEGADIGIVSCERWCEVETNDARGWIHSDFVVIGNAPEALAELVEPEVAVTPAPFTANAAGSVGIYDSPYEDGEITQTVRNGDEIFIVGCDPNWCEARFDESNRRGWVDRRLLRMPDGLTDAAIPPLPAITREEAATLRAAAL